MEWDEDEIVVEITADVVEVEIAETATDVSIDEEKIELEIAAPEENTLEIAEDLIELELIAEPEIVIETGEGSGKAVWGFITGELGDQEDLAAALDGKSDTGHTHDDRYYTEQEIDAALAVINTALAGKSNTGHIHDDRYYTETETDTLVSGKVSKSGDTMTGDLTLINDKNLLLKPSGASSDASGDIAWYYGNGQEKMRIWGENSYSTKKGPNFRMGKKDGTQLFSGTLSLSDHTHDDRYYTETEMDTKLNGKANSSHTHNSVVGSNNTAHTLGMAWTGDITAPDWFCAWGPQTGYSQVVRAISVANTKKRLSSVLPSIKRIIKNIGSVTMGSGGYKSVSSFKPADPSGYTFLFCSVWDYGTSSNPNTAHGINASGNYMYGGANSTITGVVIAYFYVLTENMTSTTG